IIGEPDEDISALESKAQAGKAEPAPAPSAEPPPVPTAGETTAKAPPPTPPGGNGRPPAPARGTTSGRTVVSPLTGRLPCGAGIARRSLSGSGQGGRNIKRDMEAAMSRGGARAEAGTKLRVVQPLQKSALVGASAYRDEPLTVIRKTIANRLVTSLGPVPHFFLTSEIEMDRAVEMRQSIKALDPDLKISINDIIIKVAAAVLLQHPQVNASFQEKSVRYYEQADIGVAV